MSTDKKNIFWVTVTLAVVILGLFRVFSGDYDRRNEKSSKERYTRNSAGIIDGAESIIYENGNDRAMVFFHGFMSTPLVFRDLINNIKDSAQSDIFAPLLPYDGRDLKTLSKTDNTVVLNFMDKYIQQLAHKYRKLTVVGLSYGGARLANLAANNQIPENVTLVFYAPALFIKTNTKWQRRFCKIYSHWRDYCDYSLLGCEYPNYSNADDSARKVFKTQLDFHYVDVPALLTMYKFDLENRNDIANIHRPFNIIMAVDDNRVNYSQIRSRCVKNNQYCKFYSFKSGKHLIHWGKNQETFVRLLLMINEQEP